MAFLSLFSATSQQLVLVWLLIVSVPFYLVFASLMARGLQNLYVLSKSRGSIIYRYISWILPFRDNETEFKSTQILLLAILIGVVTIVILAILIMKNLLLKLDQLQRENESNIRTNQNQEKEKLNFLTELASNKKQLESSESLLQQIQTDNAKLNELISNNEKKYKNQLDEVNLTHKQECQDYLSSQIQDKQSILKLNELKQQSHIRHKEEKLCDICFEKQKNHRADPCGHLYCEHCQFIVKLSKECYFCRSEVINMQKIYQ